MREEALAALDRVTSYYEDQMWAGGSDHPALQYLMGERRFTEQTLRQFRIGFAPLTPIASAVTPTDLEILKSLGHVYDNGKDMFSGRVTFPIADDQGRTRGFGARIMVSAPHAEKYINSPTSFVFRKADYMFGMSHAREAIFIANNAIACEGYTDVLAFHQTGKPIAVGAMGTYFTLGQLLQIGRYTMNLYTAFDMDSAGDEATKKSREMARAMAFRLGYLPFPDGMDPDEYLIPKS